MHAGEEGVASSGAALLSVVVHKDRTLIADAVDVGRFPDHQAAVADARLHPANVVAHDEQDIGFLLGGCHPGQQWYSRQDGHNGAHPEHLLQLLSSSYTISSLLTLMVKGLRQRAP